MKYFKFRVFVGDVIAGVSLGFFGPGYLPCPQLPEGNILLKFQ